MELMPCVHPASEMALDKSVQTSDPNHVRPVRCLLALPPLLRTPHASGLTLPLLSLILSTLLRSSSNRFLRLTSASFLFSRFWKR